MGLFGFRKKGKILDLTERYKKQQAKAEEINSENLGTSEANSSSQENTGGAFSFLGNLATSSGANTENLDNQNISGNSEEKRKKLAKRFMDMTDRIEDLSNQIYHLQQRIEVLERKIGVGGI